MAIISFYLFGKDQSKPENIQKVDIDITHNLEAAQVHVADVFSVVEPKGVGFQTADGQALTDLDAVLDADQPVAVTIDGHAIREVPGPKGLPLFGNYYEVYPDHMGNHQRLFEKFGPVIQHTEAGRTVYLTNDPAVALHVLQESPFWSKVIEGAHPLMGAKNNDSGLFVCDTDTRTWRLAHKFLPPALAPKAVRKYTPMTQVTAEEAFHVFDEFAERDEAFEAFGYMFKLTSQAVTKLALGVDLHHFDSADTPVHPMVSAIAEFLGLMKKANEYPSWYLHMPFGVGKRLRDVQTSFFNVCRDAIKKAQEKGGEDLPIATAALEASSIADFAARAVDEQGNKLPEDVALGSLPVIIGAGFATTATLLSWLFYCAATYPGTQERLVQELIDHGVTADFQHDYDSVNDLACLDKFVKETQRLYNPAYQPARTAMREQIIPGGYQLPKGAVVVCALHAIHRNPAVWDDPARFNPDRWDTDKVRNRPSSAYIPFAMGPRSCIGFNFALQEAKVMFSTLLYRYEIARYGDDNIDYDPQSQLFRPTNLYLRFRRRTSWPTKST